MKGSATTDVDKIWNRFLDGEESCFKVLFKHFHQEMYGYGLKLCNDSELIKDCIQDLFKTIWERREDLDHIDSPRVYLFVSLRRKILREARKSGKKTALAYEDENDIPISFSIEDIIITSERKQQCKQELNEALNQLSNRQKEVVYLHYYNGMSYGEIEQILSINRQSVRNHIYRAMESLRSLLDKEVMKLVIMLVLAICFSLFFG